jgi:arylsulfatase A-like enzyme
MDHHVGRLLDDLRGRGVLDNALLVVTSDHGENLWDHPALFDHGLTLYQSTMRAVCIIRLPGAEKAGTRVDQLMASIDVLPTTLRWLRLGIPSPIDGEAVDLRALDKPIASRTRYGQATKPWRDVETDSRWTNMRKARCIREGNYKFVQIPFRGTEELYELESDPGESINLLQNPSAESRLLRDRLRKGLERWTASAKPLPSVFEPSQQEETIKRLRSLGYIQ